MLCFDVCSPNSPLWGSLLGKKLAAICFGRIPGACPPCVQDVSALCPLYVSTLCPSSVRFDRASKSCPACVRQMSPLCPLWPRLQTLSGMSMCLPSVPLDVRLVSAWAARPSLFVLSALSPLWLRGCLQTLSAMCPPYVRFGFPSKPRPLCAGQASRPPRLVSALCRLWPRLQALCLPCCPLCPPCVRSLFFLCPLVVLSLFALYPLFVGFWPGLWFGFVRAFLSSASALWFLRLGLFYSVSVAGRLSRGLCAFARCLSGHLWPAVLLSALKLRRAFAPCLSFSPLVLLSVFVEFVWVLFASACVRIFIQRSAMQ